MGATQVRSFPSVCVGSVLIAVLLSVAGPVVPLLHAAVSGAETAYPARLIELVVQTGPGGGSDVTARYLVQVLERHRLVPQPVIVVNRQGGAGAVALEYLRGHRGDPYFLFAVPGAGIFTNVARGRTSFDEFRQLATMGFEVNLVLVRANSPFRSIEDLVEAARSAPKAVSLGGAAIGGGGHLASLLFGRAAGVDFNFISFQSGREALTAMLGGSVDFTIESLLEARELQRAGRVRILAAMTEKRIPQLPEVPTLREKGWDAVFEIARPFAMTAGVPDAAVSWWERVLKQAFDTPEWQAFLENNGLVGNFLDAASTEQYFRRTYGQLEPILGIVVPSRSISR